MVQITLVTSVPVRAGSGPTLPTEMSQSMAIMARRPAGPSRWAAVATASVAGLSVLTGGGPAAFAHGPGFSASSGGPGAGSSRVTRAALDPALVAGRGATVDFAEQEAENATTTGAVIGP